MKKTILIELNGVAPSTSDYILSGPLVHTPNIQCIQHIGMTNETTDAKVFQVGLLDGGVFIPLKSVTVTTHLVYYTFENTIYYANDLRLAIKVLSPASGDVIKANILGYVVE